MVPIVIIAIVLVFAGVYAYAYAKTRWDIEPFPYDVLDVKEDAETVVYEDQGEIKRMPFLVQFDYDISPVRSRHCYLAATEEDAKRRHVYVITSPVPNVGPYSNEVSEELRKCVQDVIVEAFSSPEKYS